jgi:hypothetical protein
MKNGPDTLGTVLNESGSEKHEMRPGSLGIV